MRIAVAAAVVLSLASAASAQTSFSIGPRLSSYSANIDTIATSVDSGRETSFGLVGDVRSGRFVLDYNWDHDPASGLSLTSLFGGIAYERDRGEVTIGYAMPKLDIQGGFRADSINVGGFSFFGNQQIDHNALTAGLRFHTGDRQPLGFYALGRGYIGTADVEGLEIIGNDADTNGFRLESGVMIRFGQSRWYAVPGVEYERIESDNDIFEVESNRVFVNFVYRN